MILLAIFLPPLVVFLCGKPFQGIVNLLIWLAAWLGAFLAAVPGVFLWVIACGHAVLVLNNRNADRRAQKIADAVAAGRAPPKR